ncbi:hypothetical protein AKJ16_DCAP24557 [Drosera capensis]
MSTPDTLSNKYYLGPAPLDQMAWQIATAVGPCGNNKNYLFSLERALHDIGHEDEKIIQLANEVRKVLEIIGRGGSKEKKMIAGHIATKTDIPSLKTPSTSRNCCDRLRQLDNDESQPESLTSEGIT